jgi:hypothetical protein
VLNRFFNRPRRPEPQAFPPRKRSLATNWFGPDHPDASEFAAFVPDEAPTPDAAVPDAVAAPEQADPSVDLSGPTTAAEPRLAIGQMVASVRDGLLMVFGPEGDPVPPQAFVNAAEAEPEAVVILSDGAAVPASRVAVVLKAQTLGRLGAAEDGGWIMAMLRDQDRPEMASEEDLAAGHDDCVLTGTGDETPPAQPSAPVLEQVELSSPSLEPDLAAPVAMIDDDMLELGSLAGPERPEAVVEIPMAVSPDGVAPSAASDDEVLRPMAASSLDPESAWGEAVASPEPAAAFPEPVAAAPESVASAPDSADSVDADSIVLVMIRGVPDDVRLSAGVRDDDGSWSLSPLDLPDLTITPASGGGGVGEMADRELTITGIALTDGGVLTAFSETVPLADYLTDGAGSHETFEGAEATPAPGDRQADSGPAAIVLDVDPALWHGEQFDALVVRDVPAGARLSAGAHDVAIDGWVLRPQDLRRLAIIPPADQRTDFTLTLLGVVLRSGDANAARVLTRLPVRLA